jgi:hypothetical protein
MQLFEQHEGVQVLRRELVAEREKPEGSTTTNRLNGQKQILFRILSKLRVDEWRAAWQSSVSGRRAATPIIPSRISRVVEAQWLHKTLRRIYKPTMYLPPPLVRPERES